MTRGDTFRHVTDKRLALWAGVGQLATFTVGQRRMQRTTLTLEWTGDGDSALRIATRRRRSPSPGC